MNKKIIARLFATIMVASLAITGCGKGDSTSAGTNAMNTTNTTNTTSIDSKNLSVIEVKGTSIDLAEGSVETVKKLADLNLAAYYREGANSDVLYSKKNGWVELPLSSMADEGFEGVGVGLTDRSLTYRYYTKAMAQGLDKATKQPNSMSSFITYQFAYGTDIHNPSEWDEQTYEFKTCHGVTRETSVEDLAKIAKDNNFISLIPERLWKTNDVRCITLNVRSLPDVSLDYSTIYTRYVCVYVDGKQINWNDYADQVDKLVMSDVKIVEDKLAGGGYIGNSSGIMSHYRNNNGIFSTSEYFSDADAVNADYKNTVVLEYVANELAKDVDNGKVKQVVVYDYHVKPFDDKFDEKGKYSMGDSRIRVDVTVFQKETEEVLKYFEE